MRQATKVEVRLEASGAARFSASAQSSCGFDASWLLACRRLCLPELPQICILGMVSVLRRHLVASEAGVERGNLFLRLDLCLAGGDILAGKDRLTGGNVGLAVGAN